ncbi:MAG: glycosyltransferase [Saprospiraceae bacterium]
MKEFVGRKWTLFAKSSWNQTVHRIKLPPKKRIHCFLRYLWPMIAVLFLAALLVQLVYRWFVFSPWLFEKKPRPENEIAQACSVVICARNEAVSLRANLPFILKQNHPNFEVLVIDDASTDTTREVLRAFSEQDQRLRFYFISKKEKAGKREALTLGLEKAQHSLVVLTDADCRPASSHWLQKMQLAFGPDTDLVLGYSPMAPDSGFLIAWCRFETAFTALQYFSMAARGNPYMGVGRNIAWRREVLLKFLQEQPQKLRFPAMMD